MSATPSKEIIKEIKNSGQILTLLHDFIYTKSLSKDILWISFYKNHYYII